MGAPGRTSWHEPETNSGLTSPPADRAAATASATAPPSTAASSCSAFTSAREVGDAATASRSSWWQDERAQSAGQRRRVGAVAAEEGPGTRLLAAVCLRQQDGHQARPLRACHLQVCFPPLCGLRAGSGRHAGGA